MPNILARFSRPFIKDVANIIKKPGFSRTAEELTRLREYKGLLPELENFRGGIGASQASLGALNRPLFTGSEFSNIGKKMFSIIESPFQAYRSFKSGVREAFGFRGSRNIGRLADYGYGLGLKVKDLISGFREDISGFRAGYRKAMGLRKTFNVSNKFGELGYVFGKGVGVPLRALENTLGNVRSGLNKSIGDIGENIRRNVINPYRAGQRKFYSGAEYSYRGKGGFLAESFHRAGYTRAEHAWNKSYSSRPVITADNSAREATGKMQKDLDGGSSNKNIAQGMGRWLGAAGTAALVYTAYTGVKALNSNQPVNPVYSGHQRKNQYAPAY